MSNEGKRKNGRIYDMGGVLKFHLNHDVGAWKKRGKREEKMKRKEEKRRIDGKSKSLNS